MRPPWSGPACAASWKARRSPSIPRKTAAAARSPSATSRPRNPRRLASTDESRPETGGSFVSAPGDSDSPEVTHDDWDKDPHEIRQEGGSLGDNARGPESP